MIETSRLRITGVTGGPLRITGVSLVNGAYELATAGGADYELQTERQTTMDNILFIPGIDGRGLLEKYPNAVFAQSFRKLRKSYNGPCLRVRRASDNAEQNIGFAGSLIDTAALQSFCVGTNGFITTWYDQGLLGNNCTATVSTRQPQVIDGGSLILDNNGKVSMRWNDVPASLDYAVPMPSDTFFLYTVAATAPSSSDVGIFGNQILSGAVTGGMFYATNTAGNMLLRMRNTADTGTVDVTRTSTASVMQVVQVFSDTANNANLAINAGTPVVSAGSTSFGAAMNCIIGNGTIAGRFLNSTYGEIVLWPVARGNSRLDIIANANAFFGAF